MNIELRLREIMVVEDPGVQVTEAVLARVGERPVSAHGNGGIAQIAEARARRRSRYILIGALLAVGAAAAGLWTQWSGMATPDAPASMVASVPSPAPAAPVQPVASEPLLDELPQPPPSVFTARAPTKEPVPDKAAERQSDAEKCCVPALPGVEGYWVPASSSAARFSIALGEEEMDLAWAPDMERRIKEALQKVDELRGVQLKMVCRSTACGLLFIFSPDDDFDALGDRVQKFKPWAKDELGFTSSGTISMHPGDGKRYIVLRLTGARGQVQNDPAAAAAMSAVLAPPSLPPNPQFMSVFTDPGVRATEKLAQEPVDRSTTTAMLENQIQKEVLGIFGTELNRLTVECRVSTCVVVVGFPPGVSPDLSPMIARISRVVGPSTIANVSRLSGQDGDTAAIELKR